jgi:hypothetical protein
LPHHHVGARNLDPYIGFGRGKAECIRISKSHVPIYIQSVCRIGDAPDAYVVGSYVHGSGSSGNRIARIADHDIIGIAARSQQHVVELCVGKVLVETSTWFKPTVHLFFLHSCNIKMQNARLHAHGGLEDVDLVILVMFKSMGLIDVRDFFMWVCGRSLLSDTDVVQTIKSDRAALAKWNEWKIYYQYEENMTCPFWVHAICRRFIESNMP